MNITGSKKRPSIKLSKKETETWSSGYDTREAKELRASVDDLAERLMTKHGIHKVDLYLYRSTIPVVLVGRRRKPTHYGSRKLLSSTPGKHAQRLVEEAAEDAFGSTIVDVFYEHGQWWVTIEASGQYWPDRTFSVVDAYPGVSHGLDFEPIG